MYFKNHRKLIGLAVTVILADGLFFSLSDPAKVPSFLLIVGYGLAVMTLWLVVHLVMAFINLYIPGKRRISPRVSQLVTVVLAIILAMQSIGQLSARDVLAMAPLVIIGCLYVTYNRSKRPTT